MGVSRSYLKKKYGTKLQIGQCKKINRSVDRYSRRSFCIGKIHRLSKNTYVFQTENTSKNLRGKVTTYSDALVAIFAAYQRKDLMLHKIKSPEIAKPRKTNQYPHQEIFFREDSYATIVNSMFDKFYARQPLRELTALEDPNTVTITDYEVLNT